MAELHIIAACSDRKRIEPSDRQRLRAHRFGNARAERWRRALADPSLPRLKAVDLYQGNHWATVRVLPAIAGERGWKAVHLWVASAGHGLIRADDEVASYSATFADGPDSVVDPAADDSAPTQRRAWWHALNGGEWSLQASARATVLVIASRPYLDAVGEDLIATRRGLRDWRKLVVLSTRMSGHELDASVVNVAGDVLLADGGPMTSLHARAAAHCLRVLDPAEFALERARATIGACDRGSAPRPMGRRLSDDDVLSFIESESRRQPTASANALLRSLRDSGLACEQARFRRLHAASLVSA